MKYHNLLRQPMLFFILAFKSGFTLAASSSDSELQILVREFIPAYTALHIPELELSYIENFKHIQDLLGIQRQRYFFNQYRRDLLSIDRSDLETENRYLRDNLLYEFNLNLSRLDLEHNYRKFHPSTDLPTDGISHMPDGKRWYSYYIERWSSKHMTPHRLLKFGEDEVGRISAEIAAIQAKLGYTGNAEGFYQHLNDPSFLITNQLDLVQSLTSIRDSIQTRLNGDFADTNIPVVAIKPIQNPNKDTPPGYYEDGVFYFNFYQNRFRKRNLQWLFLHEANPGHHFQNSVARSRTTVQKLFWYPGFTEGWGAYSEDLGKDLGQYQDIYQQLGKWEWDLVRSARVVLDVGLNYFGWSKDRARTYWNTHVPNQEDIREREIDRMIRWPAQVLSYKVGEQTFLQLKKHLSDNQGKGFDLRDFHTQMLKRGSIPLDVLTEIALDSGTRTKMSWSN